jgi:hypothetical protein
VETKQETLQNFSENTQVSIFYGFLPIKGKPYRTFALVSIRVQSFSMTSAALIIWGSEGIFSRFSSEKVNTNHYGSISETGRNP